LQGEVIEIIHRKRTEFIGRLEMNKSGKDGKAFAFFIADMDKPMPDIFIPFNNLNGADDNDRVVVRLLNWENGDKRPMGEVVSLMDAENSNDAAMKEIILGAGFALSFSDEAMEEAARIPDIISESEKKPERYQIHTHIYH
jgi:ribonuclease R